MTLLRMLQTLEGDQAWRLGTALEAGCGNRETQPSYSYVDIDKTVRSAFDPPPQRFFKAKVQPQGNIGIHARTGLRRVRFRSPLIAARECGAAEVRQPN